ncbi:sterol desaturase family protein [Novilysobacter spongiicola]|uniref:Sterol desaturase/sphingolipid hydroxylase, fatty acid hydroxylase superfamily n=1 Tax=Lysobacter spongiicola DSM 21749 TaxID=1122188 RepID=A0A1T4R9N2_9GAMM|nr:sterol desaturase family protein [Lysobacter spongiicola]SKA12526.1 Sterol desaturase/sphingolipid hydroxylase, fatty acid hydroxylase superfamily [Lysobacter spongiicola DSM 21749]
MELDLANDRYPRLRSLVERAGHPFFLLGALALWWAMGLSEVAALVAAAIILLLMEWLERAIPAKPSWRLSVRARLALVGWYVALLLVAGLVLASYEALVTPTLVGVREGLGSGIWPEGWPLLLQVLMLYFAADLIYYWIHRAIHRFGWFWRLSGHGVHHAFHNLHALNVSATHPLETLFLTLPMVLLAGLFGAPSEAVAGAVVLLVVNGTLAHANLRMRTPMLDWFFTSSNQHRRHHSQVFEHSNSNYACNAIMWDRLFGTYSDGDVEQTGIGPRQPSVWEMLRMPWREPGDVDTAASRARGGR